MTVSRGPGISWFSRLSSAWSVSIASLRVDFPSFCPREILVWNHTISPFQIRKIAITASKENVFWTPANPKMDPVNPVRNATTDGIRLPAKVVHLRLDLTETMPNEVDVVVCAVVAAVPDVADLEAEAAEGNATLTGNLAMTRRKFLDTCFGLSKP